MKSRAEQILTNIEEIWKPFEDYFLKQYHNKSYFKYEFNYNKKSVRLMANYSSYYRSTNLHFDMNNFFFDGNQILNQDESSKTQKIKTYDAYLKSLGLNCDILKSVEPLIYSKNWFQNEKVEEISEELELDLKTVFSSIGAITSKDYGFYFYDS